MPKRGGINIPNTACGFDSDHAGSFLNSQAQKAVDTLLPHFETARRQYAAMVTKLNELTQRETDWYKADP